MRNQVKQRRKREEARFEESVELGEGLRNHTESERKEVRQKNERSC